MKFKEGKIRDKYREKEPRDVPWFMRNKFRKERGESVERYKYLETARKERETFNKKRQVN